MMRISSTFGDNMVLQQGMPIPVWGWAAPDEEVRVRFHGQSARGTAGPDGKWMVRLAPEKAGGPFELVAESPGGSVVLKNVLVGEVWIASGQSNMVWTVTASKDAEKEICEATFDQIRLFLVAREAILDNRHEVNGQWNVCSPGTVGNFSAVAYFYGRELHRKLGVPVGLIDSSWGGTIAEAWTSRAKLVSMPLFKDAVETYEARLVHFERDCAAYQKKLTEGESKAYPSDPGNNGFAKGWADPGTNTGDWEPINVPSYWQGAGMDFSGVVWFRRDVVIPAEWAGRELVLNLCPCDKYDTTYFNNVEVGAMGAEQPNAWDTPRRYTVPAGIVRPGRNTLAVRVYSYAYAGGIMGSSAQLHIGPVGAPDSARIRLAGEWQCKVEHNFGKVASLVTQAPQGPGNSNSLYILFHSMIQPLIPTAIRGAIWYQGESNVPRASEYRALFPAMIQSWREAWGQGEFPFYFVQLCNYLHAADAPEESQWAELREAQFQALALPNTGMAVAIDIGEAADIHPKNKQDVGLRLAANALHDTYGRKDIVPSGPIFAGATVESTTIRVRFNHAEGGLVAQGGELTGFAIAGPNKRFVWANARVDGETVVVFSDAVKAPAHVRYGWANNPACNLYNQAGLPASPFRSDRSA